MIGSAPDEPPRSHELLFANLPELLPTEANQDKVFEAFALNRAAMKRYGFTFETFLARTDYALFERIRSFQVMMCLCPPHEDGEVETLGVMGELTWKAWQKFVRWKSPDERQRVRQIRWLDLDGTWRAGPEGKITYSPYDPVRPKVEGQLQFVEPGRLHAKTLKLARKEADAILLRTVDDIEHLNEARRLYREINDRIGEVVMFCAPKVARVLGRDEFPEAKFVMPTSKLPAEINYSFLARLSDKLGKRVLLAPLLGPKVKTYEVELYRRRLDELEDVEEEFWTLHENPRLTYSTITSRVSGSMASWRPKSPIAQLPDEDDNGLLVECPPTVEFTSQYRIRRDAVKNASKWSDSRRRRFMQSRAIRKARNLTP